MNPHLSFSTPLIVKMTVFGRQMVLTFRRLKQLSTRKKVQEWGMMSSCAVSELHVVSPKTTVNGVYYRENILSKEGLDALTRTATGGSVLERKMVESEDQAIFMQDGAPLHTARATQQWCQENFPGFWEKGIWPGNSPDLNPIENLWSIMQQKLDEEKRSSQLSEHYWTGPAAEADVGKYLSGCAGKPGCRYAEPDASLYRCEGWLCRQIKTTKSVLFVFSFRRRNAMFG